MDNAQSKTPLRSIGKILTSRFGFSTGKQRAQVQSSVGAPSSTPVQQQRGAVDAEVKAAASAMSGAAAALLAGGASSSSSSDGFDAGTPGHSFSHKALPDGLEAPTFTSALSLPTSLAEVEARGAEMHGVVAVANDKRRFSQRQPSDAAAQPRVSQRQRQPSEQLQGAPARISRRMRSSSDAASATGGRPAGSETSSTGGVRRSETGKSRLSSERARESTPNRRPSAEDRSAAPAGRRRSSDTVAGGAGGGGAAAGSSTHGGRRVSEQSPAAGRGKRVSEQSSSPSGFRGRRVSGTRMLGSIMLGSSDHHHQSSSPNGMRGGFGGGGKRLSEQSPGSVRLMAAPSSRASPASVRLGSSRLLSSRRLSRAPFPGGGGGGWAQAQQQRWTREPRLSDVEAAAVDAVLISVEEEAALDAALARERHEAQAKQRRASLSVTTAALAEQLRITPTVKPPEVAMILEEAYALRACVPARAAAPPRMRAHTHTRCC